MFSSRTHLLLQFFLFEHSRQPHLHHVYVHLYRRHQQICTVVITPSLWSHSNVCVKTRICPLHVPPDKCISHVLINEIHTSNFYNSCYYTVLQLFTISFVNKQNWINIIYTTNFNDRRTASTRLGEENSRNVMLFVKCLLMIKFKIFNAIRIMFVVFFDVALNCILKHCLCFKNRNRAVSKSSRW